MGMCFEVTVLAWSKYTAIVIALEELYKVCGEIYDTALCVSRISDMRLGESIGKFNFLLPQKTYLELYEIGGSDGSDCIHMYSLG
jgi:hypothetical protein